MINSKYDTWQAGAIIGAGQCGNHISNCSTAIKNFWIAYGVKMVQTLVGLPVQHGGFLSNCQAHCQTGNWGGNATIDGTMMGTAFVDWYNDTMAVLGGGDTSVAADMAVRNSGSNATDHRHYETCEIGRCGADRC